MTTTRLRHLCRLLRKDFPLNAPVRVRLADIRHHGDTSRGRRAYYIRIRRTDPSAVQEGTLLHEWAHALTWSRRDEPHHSERWGHKYAELTRWFQAEDEWEDTRDTKP